MRNLTKTLAVISILAPVEGHPLGIGNIKLHSALNQNLNAEIPLVLSETENVADVLVKLAPPEKFEEAGVPWGYFLTNLKFQTVVKSDGSAVIKVSSKEVVKEPFLNFLLEVAWPQGDLYREFTVLVDPPATYSQPIIPVSTIAEAPKKSSYQSKTSGAVSDGTYGPVQRNDTLWEIAKRLNPGDASIEQMMIALYESNPSAFYKPNVNTLTAGATLRIPEKAAILKLSRQQARAEFSRQNIEWRNRYSSPAVTSDIQVAKDDTGSQLKLIAPSESVVDEAVVVATGEGELIPAEIESVSQENQQLKSQIDGLQQQLSELQQKLAIKDEQLAALQSGQALVEKQIDQPVETEQKAQEQVATVEQEKKPEQVKPEPKPEPKPKPAVSPEPEGDNYYTYVFGIGAGVLGLLGWLWWRRKKIDDDIAAESMFSSSFSADTGFSAATDQDASVSPPKDDSLPYDVGTVGESSILSEFTPSDFDAFETDQSEVDPISEADVYLAYGRYQQAEELMRQAIEDQPDRDECKLKLLEIYYANEDKQAFETYAQSLVDAGKNKDAEFWARVIEMSNEICPESSIFVEADSDESGAAADSSSTEQGDVDLSSIEKEQEVESEVSLDSGLDMDLSEPVDEEPVTPQVDVEPEEKIESFDFELTTDSDESDTQEPLDFGSDTDEIPDSYDFSSDLQTEELADELSDSDTGTDFNLELDASDLEAGTEGGVSDLTDMDEYETKIDLAKAYVDMGDEEAAKDIAKEVLEKGTDEQKKEAQSILDKL